MKLAVSNIAWQSTEEEYIFQMLKQYDVTGIEIAPTKIWQNPTNEPLEAFQEYKHALLSKGFYISSVQAILFAHPELTIFENEYTRNKTLAYILKIVQRSSQLGAEVIVFGSPKNRQRGRLSYQEATAIAAVFFRKIADECKKFHIFFCLEPNAKEYGNDFLVTTQETIDFLARVDHPNLRLNLDSGNMLMNNEHLEESISMSQKYLAHFQISEPHLSPIGTYIKEHLRVAKALKAIHYDTWFSLEMRSTTNPPNNEALASSLQCIKEIYG